ncbi:MAG: hypothetical protein HYU97_01210 [Deltaproteobacteria bacterium]|nr:hypothetical protein [Deltaproteobacteria bacterium]
MADSTILGILWCAATLGIGCASGCDKPEPETEPETEQPQPLPPQDEYDIFVKSYTDKCEGTAAYLSQQPACGVGKYPQAATGPSSASLYIPFPDEFKHYGMIIPPPPDVPLPPDAQGIEGCLMYCSWTANKFPFPTLTQQGTVQEDAFCEVRIGLYPHTHSLTGMENLSKPKDVQQYECRIIDSLYEYVFGIPPPQHH